MAAVALVALYAGRIAFAGMIAVGAAVLAWEWTRLCGAGRFGLTGSVMLAAMCGVVVLAAGGWIDLAIGLIVAACGTVYAIARSGGRDHPRWIAAGPLYIGLPCVAMIWLRGDATAGRQVILWLLITVWATDIGAYFAGHLIGGPRLAPRLSPNKTWAGLAGAVVCASLVGSIAAAVDPRAPTAVLLAAAGALLAVVAQAGDLGESWVKRRFAVKDASRLIPGHGGLFDRVDGLLAAATVLGGWQWLTGSDIMAWG